ncbi:MAG: hypothetical protein K2K84_09650 [Muribaculaceae bacterium]|nr:hypothetical protein [Muribaculaceae bacterium]
MTEKLKNTIIRLMFFCMAVFVLAACKDEPDPVKSNPRTVLVYMAANNSLGTGGYDSKDLTEMKQAVIGNPDVFNGGRLIIFYAPTDGTQVLYELMPGTGELQELKRYDSNQYVVSATRMNEVMDDTRLIAPADTYGLVLWSHALGWTQDGRKEESRSWGSDRGQTMNITTLASVLKGRDFDWIYFDCCYMGSVEVLYELRTVTSRIVASASEIPVDGMPYTKNLPLFFKTTPDLTAAAQNTFEYYDDLVGSERTCTIAVYNLSGMDELADATRPIYQASSKVLPGSFYNLALSLDVKPLFYDFGVYVDGMVKENGVSRELLDRWNAAYADVVEYENATPYLWNRISLERFTGMSTYIARDSNDMTYKGYDTLEWYETVGKYLYVKE